MESKFKGLLTNLRPVNTGTKASNDVVPTLVVLGIPNKFQLNKLASIALGLSAEDRVKMFDMGIDADINERFFIAKTDKNDTTAAKVAASNSATKATSGIDLAFNYAGIWSCLTQGVTGAVELGYEAMVEKGVVVKGVTTGGKVRYRSAFDVKLEVVECGAATIDEVEYEMVYVCTNMKRTVADVEDINEVEGPTTNAFETDPFAEAAEQLNNLSEDLI